MDSLTSLKISIRVDALKVLSFVAELRDNRTFPIQEQ